MRAKKEVLEYQVYDCPICGEEIRQSGGAETPCRNCRRGLYTWEQYYKHENLIGATVTDILVSSDGLEKLYLTSKNDKHYTVTIDYDEWGSDSERLMATESVV